jgi:hypothetical protein
VIDTAQLWGVVVTVLVALAVTRLPIVARGLDDRVARTERAAAERRRRRSAPAELSSEAADLPQAGGSLRWR